MIADVGAASTAATDQTTVRVRVANTAALTAVLLLGGIAAVLLSLPRPQPITGKIPRVAALPSPRQQAVDSIRLTIAAVEAYFTDHHTYAGVTLTSLGRYGVGRGPLANTPMSLYFASGGRYCVEYQEGWTIWSQNGPLAPLQAGHCRLITLRDALPPHAGHPPRLPLLPRQAPIRPTILGEDQCYDGGGVYNLACHLNELALRLDAYWIQHGGSYSGAEHALRNPGPDTYILNAHDSTYCITAYRGRRTLVKAGPAARIHTSRQRGEVACANR
jgi:hypothetical protein